MTYPNTTPIDRKSPKIVSIIAGLPHPVKAAPLHRALRSLGANHVLLDLGCYSTNFGMKLYRALQLPAPFSKLELKIATKNDSAIDVKYESAIISDHLADLKPHAVIVYGDLPGSVAAAMAACGLGIRIAHVEAGRRSHDANDAEEFNRLIISSIADLHLAPSESAMANLIFEGISRDDVAVTGNLAIATLCNVISQLASPRPKTPRQLMVAFHRYELSANPEKNEACMQAIDVISTEIPVKILDYGHPFLRSRIRDTERITLVPRLSIYDYATEVIHSSAVLTDSSGLQDDTAALGIPCVTMRTATHCVESVEAGTNVVVGYDSQAAVSQLRLALERNVGSSSLRRWGVGAGMKAARVICKFADSEIYG